MINFTKNNVIVSGRKDVSVFYVTESGERKFVARFRHFSPKASANHFVKFLIQHFTADEYFAAYDKGEAPVRILQSKGYVSYAIERSRKQALNQARVA